VKPAQVDYSTFSDATRRVMRPSIGADSSWMLKPLPSLCAQALPMRVQNPLPPLELGFFIAGAIGYRAYRFMVKHNLTDRPECKWIAAASLLIILYALWGDMNDMSIYWISTIATAICLPFLFSVSRNNRIDRLIGNISYPVYISHMAVIIAAKHIIGKFQDEKTGILLDNKIGIVIVLCVLLVSVLAYYAVERPIDRFRHRRFGFSLTGSSPPPSPAFWPSLAFIGTTPAKRGSIRAARLPTSGRTTTRASVTAAILPPTRNPLERRTRREYRIFSPRLCRTR